MATKKGYTAKSVSKNMQQKIEPAKPMDPALHSERMAVTNQRRPVLNPAKMTEGNKRVQPKQARPRRGVR